MEHAILYKRAKTGAVQFWSIEVDHQNIIKRSGKLGTENPLTHKEFIKTGKNIGKANQTTPVQQAEAQALSDWNKKRDEGYKSLEDLQITDHGTYVNAHGQDLCLEEMLDTLLPEFNTDAAGNVKPMLAKAVDWNKVTYPCHVQPKLDGVRCLMVVNKEEITFLSRNGKPYTTLNHISDNLWKLGAGTVPDNFILDGEIYSNELTFQEIIAAVKKQRDNSLKLKFRAYDIVNDKNQHERLIDVRTMVTAINSEHILMVQTEGGFDKAGIKGWHDRWVQEGYEGAMIRLYDGKYGQGQRSSALLKVKEFDETEYPFLRWEIGQRPEDLIAVLDANQLGEFRAKMVGTVAEKLILQDHPAATGDITIKHFGFTTDGLPRFPIGKAFRDID